MRRGTEPMRASMPRHIYETLSEHGQYIARYIVAQPGEELATGFRDDLGTTPPGLRDRPQKSRPRPFNVSPPHPPEPCVVFLCRNPAFGRRQ